ncbi:unnamed protein product [Rotaria socialis]|uniref:Uncharacterized protein n=1 Tax=Rotaria socialis TaxID=392032 RepID=A0A820Q7F8_9BILA|nr:unnamed protein product [Rotaria socialis]CAF4523979.1 unnamed protein product [Rotaria socialis]CAF4553846.1 unnamed protein product [Rotaria socialis]
MSTNLKKDQLNLQLSQAYQKLQADPRDLVVLREFLDIRIQLANLLEHCPNETSSSSVEQANNEVSIEQSNNEVVPIEPLSQSSSMNMPEQTNNNGITTYWQLGKTRMYQWIDNIIVGLIVCFIGAFILNQVTGAKTIIIMHLYISYSTVYRKQNIIEIIPVESSRTSEFSVSLALIQQMGLSTP